MRILRQFSSSLREGFRGVWRNKGMGTASVISITSVLVLFGLILLLILNINNIVYQTSAKLDKIVVFLNDGISDEQRIALEEKIMATGYVDRVDYKTKEVALEEFKEQLKGNEYILEGLEGTNPLPESLSVELINIEDAGAVVESIKDEPVIEDIDYYNDFIERMIQIEQGVKVLGFVIIGILLFVAVVLIHNTIKITLNNRRREINIMKYIGATNRYIRGPFLVEGIIFGLIGSILAILIVYYSYNLFFTGIDSRLVEQVDVNLVSPKGIWLDISIIFLCIGVGIGYLGSKLSMNRYLNV